VSVGLAEALEDPSILVVGTLKCMSDSPDPLSFSGAQAMEEAESLFALLIDVPLAQPVVSSVDARGHVHHAVTASTMANTTSGRPTTLT